jgi:hypothetical protein
MIQPLQTARQRRLQFALVAAPAPLLAADAFAQPEWRSPERGSGVLLCEGRWVMIWQPGSLPAVI